MIHYFAWLHTTRFCFDDWESQINIARSRGHTMEHLISLVRQHPKRTLDPLNFRKRTVPATKFIEMSPGAPALVVTTFLRPHAGSALLPHFRSDGNGAMRFRHGGKVATVITEPSLFLALYRSFAANARKKAPAKIFIHFSRKMQDVLQIIVGKFRSRRNEYSR